MTRDEFKDLGILDQVNYINEELKIHNSMTKVCKLNDLRRQTIQKWFEEEGYFLNKDLNQYTKVYESKPGHQEPQQDQDKPGKNQEPQELIKNPSNSKKKVNNTNTQEAKTKALEGQIKSLEEHINNIYKLLENRECTEVNKSIQTNIIHIDIEQLQGTKTITRSYKLYESVDKRLQERIQKHIDSNKQYKKQDIINSIILNYLDSIE